MAKKRLNEATKKRLRAGRMLLAGKRPAEVALAVGVARQTVYTWKGLLDEGGIDALRAVPGRGRPAKLDAAQLEGVRRAVLQKPTEHGFGTELWCCYQAPARRAVRPDANLANSGFLGLQCAEARETRHRAQRRWRARMEASHMAGA